MLTGLYLAVFAIFQAVMIPWIVKTRMKEKESLGVGSDFLHRKIRVYGNFIETVPMAVLLMLVVELGGAPLVYVHMMGVMMIISRSSHAFGIMDRGAKGPFRQIGMGLAIFTYIIGAALCAGLYFGVL